MEQIYKIKNIEIFKEELKKLNFVALAFSKSGEFLVLDNRVRGIWNKFWDKDWLFQVLKDKITHEYYVCFTNCNNFKNLEFEEIINCMNILIIHTEREKK